VQVKNGLAGIGTAIDDDAVTAFCDFELLG
jgi:hypothetical protein